MGSSLGFVKGDNSAQRYCDYEGARDRQRTTWARESLPPLPLLLPPPPRPSPQ